MHPVDRDELLGQRVRDAVVVGRGAGDAAEDLVRAPLAEPLAEDPVPVRPHPELRRRVRDDRRRPLDRVDLRHQRRRDQARLREELVVGPVRVLGGEPVCDRVVLAREERVQERQPEPEVPGDAREVDLRVEVARQLAVRVEAEPAARVLAERARDRRLAAVDLRAVPPVRVGRHPGRRAAALVRERIGARALDPHRPLGPRVVVGELELERLLGQVLAVAEPVVHLELEPRAGEDVDDRGGLELVARQQPAADEARVRVEQAGQLLGVGVPERDVAAEARPDHPHRGAAEVVVAPVRRPRVVRAPVLGRLRAAGPGVVEVLLAQPSPEAGQRVDAERPAAAGPSRSDGRARCWSRSAAS